MVDGSRALSHTPYEDETAGADKNADHPSSRPGNDNSHSEEPQSHSSETVDWVPESPSPPRQTIEDRIKEMELGNPLDLPWIDDHDGDTYVFIDPSVQQPEQTDQMYQVYVERYRKPLVIRSDALKRLQSSFFDELFGPTYQFRTKRRRGLEGRLPSQIKYVIDLTPPTEGDDAAWLMTELCCVDGVLNWSHSEARWQVSETLVGGQDEFTVSATNREASNPLPELSPIRHRASIERVLLAIRGIDPRLNSAVKVYTTFAVSQYFRISQSPLTDFIVRWIRAQPNCLFVEAIPEIALKIGDGLQCWGLIRDSFAILVGEEAMEILRQERSAGYSVYGRKKYDIPESYKTRIEYASKAFLERVMQSFEHLTEHDMKWMETLPEFKKLLENTDENLDPVVNKLRLALKAFARGNIYTVLYCDLSLAPSFQLGSEGGDSLYPRTSRHAFWGSIDDKKRIMTTTFWEALRIPRFYMEGKNVAGVTNLNIWAQNNWGWLPDTDKKDLEIPVQKHGIIEVLYSDLEDLSEYCLMGQSRSSSFTGPHTSSGDKPRSSWDSLAPLLHERPVSEVRSPASERAQAFWSAANNSPGPGLDYTDTKNQQTDLEPSDSESETHPPTNEKDAGGIDFDLPRFGMQVEDYINSLCKKMVSPPDADRREPMEMAMTPTLVNLDDTEWKYLPLYAGGLDDGSGGVFNDDVPIAESGFSTAGPRVHTGTGSSIASSDFDLVERKDLESTHHTSTMTNDGFSDQLDKRAVYDGTHALWDETMKGEITDGSVAASHTETGTMAAPSTTAAESVGGVLPVRQKAPEAATHPSGDVITDTETTNDKVVAAADQEDYNDIFMNNEEEQEDNNSDVDEQEEEEEEDGDWDVATEKAEGDDGMSEDEDLVVV
ncbi:MAG: hypothetical protein LQ338_001536 [Usnochroma carphineum]|nr:MAG: hypothetical protein LQ338_001536 [Usnochroma carphineum]